MGKKPCDWLSRKPLPPISNASNTQPALSSDLPFGGVDGATLCPRPVEVAAADVSFGLGALPRVGRRGRQRESEVLIPEAPSSLLVAAALRRVATEPLPRRRRERKPQAAPALAAANYAADLEANTLDVADDVNMQDPAVSETPPSAASVEWENFPPELLLDSSEDEEVVEWTPRPWDALLGAAVARLPPAHFFRSWRPNSQGVLKHLLGDVDAAEDAREVTDGARGGGRVEGSIGAEGSKGTRGAESSGTMDEGGMEHVMEAGIAEVVESCEDVQGAMARVACDGDVGRLEFGLGYEEVRFIDE